MTEDLKDLIHNAQWAIELLAKHARPFNHEYTCQVRLTQAIGAVERGFQTSESESAQCPHCKWGFAPFILDKSITQTAR